MQAAGAVVLKCACLHGGDTDLSPCDLHSVMWYFIQCDKSNNSRTCQDVAVGSTTSCKCMLRSPRGGCMLHDVLNCTHPTNGCIMSDIHAALLCLINQDMDDQS